jgi:hypothetical protein
MVMPIQRVFKLVIGVSLTIVEASGERLSEPISKKGHRGTRYYDGAKFEQARQAI